MTMLVVAFKFNDRFSDLFDNLTEVSLPGGIFRKFEQRLNSAEKLQDELVRSEGIEVATDATENDPVALNAILTGVIGEAGKKLESIGAELYQMSDAQRRDKVLMHASGNLDV
jgi:hypothetical protein